MRRRASLRLEVWVFAGLALVLAARLLAGPAYAAPPAPGLVALCAGSQTVWIALPGYDGPAPEAQTEPCPWMGLGPAVPAPDAPALAPPHRPAIPAAPHAAAAPPSAPRPAGWPRAPPA